MELSSSEKPSDQVTLHGRVLSSASRSRLIAGRNSSRDLRRGLAGSRSLVGSSSRSRSSSDISIGLSSSSRAIAKLPIENRHLADPPFFITTLGGFGAWIYPALCL